MTTAAMRQGIALVPAATQAYAGTNQNQPNLDYQTKQTNKSSSSTTTTITNCFLALSTNMPIGSSLCPFRHTNKKIKFEACGYLHSNIYLSSGSMAERGK